MKYHHNKKGSVLLYIIATMTILTALGTGVFYMTTTSSFSVLGIGAQNKARYLAEAGIHYAFANLRTLQNTTAEYKLINAAADKFILDISGIGGNANIRSTGVANPGTPFQASHKIEFLNITPAQYQQLTSAPFSFTGVGSGGITALAAPAPGAGASGVAVDLEHNRIYLGLGASDTAGCVWYQGWADSNGSDCMAGRCKFNKGIRAYFDFRFDKPWAADGFTFSIISAYNTNTDASPVYINRVTDCGGGYCGEYMGYAGPGITGNGLQPPKIAVEFDPHNSGSGIGGVCVSGSSGSATCSTRMDDLFASPKKHATFSYWGNNTDLCSTPSSNTYDDNRHGEGSGDNPRNPDNTANPDSTLPYYLRDFATVPGTTLDTGRMVFRLEIDRIDILPAGGGTYKMRAWIRDYTICQLSGCPDSNGVFLNDTSKKYYSDPPNFQQTITLTQYWHDRFDRMLFGWTQATGGLTQNVRLSNFKIDFKNKNDF
jgi:hypothetical protein